MLNQRQIRNFMYTTLAEMKAANGRDNEISTCIETETTYRYLALGSSYVADDKYVLTTGNGGDTRWVGLTGKYTTAIQKIDTKSDTLIVVIDTTKTSSGSTTSTQFKPPVTTTGKYHFWVDWGDGLFDLIASPTDPALTHTYSVSGVYTVKITGLFNGFRFNTTGDRLKLIGVDSFGSGFSIVEDRAFRGCENLVYLPSNYLDVPNVRATTTLSYCFGTAYKLTKLDLRSWDTRNITSLDNLCFLNTVLTDVKLKGCNFEKVTTLSYAFVSCKALANLDFSDLNLPVLSDISGMVSDTAITTFDFTAFTSSPITNVEYLFYECIYLASVPDIRVINTSVITKIGSMFSGTGVTSVNYADIDFRAVTSADSFITSCPNLTSIDLSGCDFRGLVYSYYLFEANPELVSVDLSNTNLVNCKSLYAMVDTCPKLTTVNFTGITLGVLEDVGSMFESCTSLTGIDLSPINFSTAKYFSYMFDNCTNLTSVGLASFNVSAATNMTAFMTGVTLNTVEYSNALIYWATLPVQSGVVCGMGNSKYNSGAVAARTYLVSTKGWTIADGGPA